MSHPRGLSVRIESVSDLTDVPILASIFDAAIIASGDDFRELLKRYVEDPYTEVEQRLEAALLHPSVGSAEQHFVFKAVETVPSLSTADSQGNGPQNAVEVQGVMPTKESIVGMAHWTVGYIDLPKVDPFAQEPTSLPTTTGPQESAGQTRLEEPMPSSVEVVNIGEHESSFDFYAVCRKPIRNTYISQIRGKKHIYLRRIAVHPEHQRRGIARQLLQWGLDRADSENLVGYLNARPLARRLYENGGFKAINVVSMPTPGLKVPDMIVMVRQPQPARRS